MSLRRLALMIFRGTSRSPRSAGTAGFGTGFRNQGAEALGEKSRTNDALQFTVGKDGTPRINLSADNMQQFLVETDAAVKAGRIDEAVKLLSIQNIATIRQMIA